MCRLKDGSYFSFPKLYFQLTGQDAEDPVIHFTIGMEVFFVQHDFIVIHTDEFVHTFFHFLSYKNMYSTMAILKEALYEADGIDEK